MRGASWVGVEGQRRVAGVLLCAVVVTCAVRGLVRSPAPARSDRQVAVQVTPRTPAELALTLGLGVDVWSEHILADRPVDVVLTPASLEVLTAAGIPHHVLVDDIQAAAADERTRLEHRATAATGADWFAEYRDLRELGDRMDLLAERHPTLASLRPLGTSVEGRPIQALKISRGGKLGIVLNGGQHAREWISVMVPMCIADRLVTTGDRDPRIRKILDAVSFYVVPVVNPDGYVHTWTVDRYWRKNRRGDHGVDLNRNYSVAWGGAGSSGNRYSETYRGPRPFSEPETQAMRGLFEREAIGAHIDFHSYSQLILYPWSHQRAAPPDRDKFAAAADRMSSAMVAAHGVPYRIRPGSELQVGASGTLGDWAYGDKAALSFLVELRPSTAQGTGGFVLPPEQIVPTCDESLAAVLALAELMMRDHASAP